MHMRLEPYSLRHVGLLQIPLVLALVIAIIIGATGA